MKGWTVNFKTEVCAKSKSAFPHISMHWIQEVFKVNRRSHDIATDCGAKRFPYDVLDAMIASALQKLLTHVHFRKRVSVEEQRAQKISTDSVEGDMIYEHFCATGANEAVQGLSELFSVLLQNDDVQDFDTRWDRALLAASEIPTDMVLEDLYKPNLQDSVQLMNKRIFETTNNRAVHQ